MSLKRNIFDILNSQEDLNGIKRHMTNTYFKSCEKMVKNSKNGKVSIKNLSVCTYLKNKLKNIDILNTNEVSSLEYFEDSGKQSNITADVVQVKELYLVEDENENSLYRISGSSPSTLSYEPQIKTFEQRKLDTKMPQMLIKRMQDSYTNELEVIYKVDFIVPPKSIEIDPKLIDLKRSEVITKLDLRHQMSMTENIQPLHCNPDHIKNLRPRKEQNRCFIMSDLREERIKGKARSDVELKIYSLKVYDQRLKDYLLMRQLANYMSLDLEYFVTKNIAHINSLELPYSEFKCFCKTPHSMKEVYLDDTMNEEDSIISLVEINRNLRHLVDNFSHTSPSISENEHCQTTIIPASTVDNSSVFKKCEKVIFIHPSKLPMKPSRRKQILTPRRHSPTLPLNIESEKRFHEFQMSSMLFSLHSLSVTSIDDIKKSSDGILRDELTPLILSAKRSSYSSILTKERNIVHFLFNFVSAVLNHLSTINPYSIQTNDSLSLIKSRFDSISSKMINFETKVVDLLDNYGRYVTNTSVMEESVTLICYSLYLCERVRDISKYSHSLLNNNNYETKRDFVEEARARPRIKKNIKPRIDY